MRTGLRISEKYSVEWWSYIDHVSISVVNVNLFPKSNGANVWKREILYALLFLTYLYTFSIKYVVVGIIYFVSYLMDMSFYCLIGMFVNMRYWWTSIVVSEPSNEVLYYSDRESKFEIS